MATTTGSFVVRLGVRDADVVRRALEGLGGDGEKALRRLDRAARVPAAGFNVLKAATGEVDGALAGLAQRSGSIGTVLASLGTKGTVAAAALAAAAMAIGAAFARARTALDSLDKLDDTAVKLGITAEGLQALRFAFGQTGAEAETVDAAIEKLSQSIGKVAALGEDAPEALRRAFARLGIEVRDTQGNVKSAETVLTEMAGGMARLQSQAERVDIARALMGRGGAALLPLLQEGVGSLDAMTGQARELGVVIDEHLVKAAGAAADKLDAMQKVVDANLNQAFLDLAPIIIGAAESFAWLARQVASVIDGFRELEQRSTTGLERRLATINEQLARPNAALERGRKGLGGTAGAFAVARDRELRQEKAEIEALLKQRADEAAARLKAAAGTIEIEPPKTGGGKDTKATRAAEREARDLARDLAADVKVIADLNRELATYGDERRQAIDAALSRVSERATAAERAEVERLAGALYDKAKAAEAAAAVDREQVRVSQEAARAARERAEAEAERHWTAGVERGLREYSDEATNASEIAENAVVGGFEAMEDALLAFTATGKLEFATMVDAMIVELGRLTLRMAVFAPLAKAMEGVDWSGLFGGSAAYGTTGAGLSPAGRTSGGTNPGFLLGGVATGGAFADGRLLAAYARGGIVNEPTVFPMARGYGLMGEAGPEAVMPLKRLASGNLGVEASQAGVTVHIHNNAGVAVRTESRQEPGGGMTLDVMLDAIENQLAGRMVRPGTPLNGALRAAANPLRAR